MRNVRLSVVVTVVDGKLALRRCLDALTNQRTPPSLQIVVPYDHTVEPVAELSGSYPEVEFLAMGLVSTQSSCQSPAGQHELFDQRRATGLAAATGEIVGLLEDRCIPRRNWASTIDRLHRASSSAVIGGAVECGGETFLSWAVYFCDYSRYQPPLVEGRRDYLTDVNISYKRAALESTRELWKDRYHETTVNWALVRSGETLCLAPELVVRHVRQSLSFCELLRERLDWGRVFAYTRASELSLVRRYAFGVAAVLLPAVLLGRHTLVQIKKRSHLVRFLLVAPVVGALVVSWSLGEMLGYLTRRP